MLRAQGGLAGCCSCQAPSWRHLLLLLLLLLRLGTSSCCLAKLALLTLDLLLLEWS